MPLLALGSCSDRVVDIEPAVHVEPAVRVEPTVYVGNALSQLCILSQQPPKLANFGKAKMRFSLMCALSHAFAELYKILLAMLSRHMAIQILF